MGLSFELSYSGIAKGLALGIGGNLRTPLFSNVSQLRLTTNMREENNLTICSFELDRIEDKTGNNINNFKLGMHAFVNSEVSENMQVEFGAHQLFSDIYTY